MRQKPFFWWLSMVFW